MELKKIIAGELTNLYPDIKPLLAERYATKYCSAVLKELRTAILRPDNDDDELSFNTTQVNQDAGRIKYQNQTLYLFAFMNRSAKTRLVDERFRGQLGKYKRVVLNPQYQEQVMDELIDEPTNILTADELDELQRQANKIIPIDLVSLVSYIEKTKQSLLTTDRKTEYYHSLQQYVLFAQEIQRIAQDVDGQYYVYEAWITSDTGREYGRFNSLQRLPQVVRHAALGICHRYDFQAHSFAVMASIARMIDPTIRIAAVEDYIKYRSAYRKRIAAEVGVPPEVIKRVFTALGFGARPVRNPYNSIRRMFYTDAKYDALIKQSDFAMITEDLKLVNKTILEYPPFTGDEFPGFNGYQFTSQRPGDTRARSANQRLAWIYQNAEAAITQEFIRIVREQMAQEPLLTTHDCVYYRQRLPASLLLDIQTIIRQDHQFQYARLEHEAIFPISTDQDYQQRFAQQEQELQQHRLGIQEEERAARGYRGTLQTVITHSRNNYVDDIIARTTQQDYSNESYSMYGYDRDNDPFYDDDNV